MNLKDDLRLLKEVEPGGSRAGEGIYGNPGAVEELHRHIMDVHLYGTLSQVEYHSQRGLESMPAPDSKVHTCAIVRLQQQGRR